MDKQTRLIVKAVSTIFFQEGFDRKNGVHGLEYWNVSEEDLHGNHFRQCKINDYMLLNTTKIGTDWYVRVIIRTYDEYGALYDQITRLLIRVDTERLCWEQLVDCVDLIEKVYIGDDE